ncbi:MAG: helix-turn-helix transcriptional regulator [Thermomicrobiales bacterium]
MQPRWDRKFFEGTRGRVVSLLRRRRQTVDELAQQLDVTDNAIRSHLAVLERDGIVRQDGLRRGVGKPAFDYNLTSEAEALFPKAYEQVLRQMLLVLSSELGHDESEALLRRVGQALAATMPQVDGSIRDRLDEAVRSLGELGGLAELHQDGERTIIQGFSCPWSGITADHPEVCRLASAMLTEYVGVPVCEACSHGERPSCRFEADLSKAS